MQQGSRTHYVHGRMDQTLTGTPRRDRKVKGSNKGRKSQCFGGGSGDVTVWSVAMVTGGRVSLKQLSWRCQTDADDAQTVRDRCTHTHTHAKLQRYATAGRTKVYESS